MLGLFGDGITRLDDVVDVEVDGVEELMICRVVRERKE